MRDGPEGAVEACGYDPAADRWVVRIWSATAQLHSCVHAYAEEGAYDGGGRWRRRYIRHFLAGGAADRVRALAMAGHFCAIIRQLAKAHGKARRGDTHYRRSFENGCADALAARLRLAARIQRRSAATLSDANAPGKALLAAAGHELRAAVASPDRSTDDPKASRHGKAAARNISLVLRAVPAAVVPSNGRQGQFQLPF
jgi:hypothetical protein